MLKLFNFFKKKGGHKIFSKWKNIPFNEVGKNKNGIDDLYNRKTDGYIIKNILSNDEVEELIKTFHQLDKSKAVPFIGREGYILPRAFSQIQNEREFDFELLDSYLNDSIWLSDNLTKHLSFNIQERITSTISLLQGGIPVTIPNYGENENKRPFTFATYRFIEMNKGGMHIHCGSMFREIYPNFYKQLDRIINFDGQLSYFLMLQRPEEGGQLRLFNAEWKDYKVHVDNKGFEGNDGSVKTMEETSIQDIDPKPGDLLIFVGGDIWHEVTSPKKGNPRITLGGFLAYAMDRKGIYIWS
jgi:hypothetical protein